VVQGWQVRLSTAACMMRVSGYVVANIVAKTKDLQWDACAVLPVAGHVCGRSLLQYVSYRHFLVWKPQQRG
jgi:hypothetical protein